MLENSLLRDDPLPPWLCDATHWPQTQPHHNTSPAAHIFALNTLSTKRGRVCHHLLFSAAFKETALQLFFWGKGIYLISRITFESGRHH